MKKVSNNDLTSNQFMFMLVGSMIGIGALTLPTDATTFGKQDAWLSTLLGAAYPIYIAFMATFIQKKFPKNNILFVNKRCFGKVIGTFFNTFLLLFFLLYLTADVSGLSNVIRGVIINFLPPLKTIIVLTFLGAYPVYTGLKILGRVNETIFCLTIFMCILLIVGILRGNYLHMLPFFQTPITSILIASKHAAFQYAGMEMFLIIYPYVLDVKNIKKLALKASFITALVYTWIVFVTIYNLGVDIIPKSNVPVALVMKYIEIPIINSFRFIFMVLWSLIVITLISNYYYAVVKIFNSFFPKVNEKKTTIIIYPFIVYLSTKYTNSVIRKDFLDFIIPKITLAMIIYIFITVIWIHFRREDDFE